MTPLLTRRSLLKTLSVSPAWNASRLDARQLRAIGAQLYTVRAVLPNRPVETLRAIREIGYTEVEATYDDHDKVWPAIAKCGLTPVSTHLKDTFLDDGQQDAFSRALEQVKGAGFRFAVIPALPEKERDDLKVLRGLGNRLNRAGEKARAAGLRLCYHNHAFDFRPVSGTTSFDMLVEHVDPKLCGFEVDCFWASVAGRDPAELIARLKGRVPMIHLKDKASGAAVRFDEQDKKPLREVGSGSIDWPKVLEAAQAAGVEHYFVEQDETPGDPLISLRKSWTYLDKLRF